MSFVHLHLHTEYSLLQGECRISEVVVRASELKMEALTITDSGALFGAVDFFTECRKYSIKPIIGCECTVAPRSRFDRTYTSPDSYSKIVLIANNAAGYKNLSKLVSLSYTEGMYGIPRVDADVLGAYSEGITALSGGIDGVVSRHLIARDISAARRAASLYKRIYGGSFYIELERHGTQREKQIEQSLINIAHDFEIPLVATNDVYFTDRSGASTQQLLTIVANGSTVRDGADNALENDAYYLKSAQEMETLFSDLPEAIANTCAIADGVDFEFDFNAVHLPAFKVKSWDNRTYLRSRCGEGLIERKKSDPSIKLSQYNERLEYELGIIEKTGFIDYYLIVDDFVRYARSKNIPVGPGRGSGVGSLAAYCMGITDVDPVRNGLLFERFLNPERVSMPDFDIDFCYERRGEVISYVIEKYGADRVAQIMTFGTLACRAAIHDAGRALGLSYQLIDTVAKLAGRARTVDEAVSESKTLFHAAENDTDVKKMLSCAKQLEGRPRNCSTHATGVVIADRPLAEYIPLAVNGDVVVTQYTMNTVAELGYLKIDFLGLRYLTVIRNAENEIKKTVPGFSADMIPFDDKATFELLSQARTAGVFQLESEGMKKLLTQLRPESLADVTLAISIYRPGPMDSIPTCLENRKHPENIKYPIPQLAGILADTYGCIIYQEQVMQICRLAAGFSYGRADIIRRAMAKKKTAQMERERKAFVDGAVKNGIAEQTAVKLYDDMSTFARYAFNKSHAAAYAVTSYRTAYLKAHYTKQYICAIMSTVAGENVKLGEYVADAASFGIRILGPDINKSEEGFSVDGDNIRFGLLGVKNIGTSLAKDIIRERENGAFTSVEDFLQRTHGIPNIRFAESLVQCGAFDSFGVYRSRLFASFPAALESLSTADRNNSTGQISIFDVAGTPDNEKLFRIQYPNIPEYTKSDILALEKSLTGMYISGHPLNEFSDCLKNGAMSVEAFALGVRDGTVPDGMSVTLLCIVSGVRNKTTKKNDVMAFVKAESEVAECEITVFPKQYAQYAPLLEQGKILLVTGKTDTGAGEEAAVRIIASLIRPAVHNLPQHDTDIYIKVTQDNRPGLDGCVKAAKATVGNSFLIVYFQEEGRLTRVRDVRCEISDQLLGTLYTLMGRENVKLQQRTEKKDRNG
ncbi:MAG TPA: DNA polymerase III subunit alpha [Bacillota bacterium]|nr:DNA polymerase III subunit alpha [Bacillota bacterium]